LKQVNERKEQKRTEAAESATSVVRGGKADHQRAS
jgi:hypothetical protein